jgi:hypothetical protein
MTKGPGKIGLLHIAVPGLDAFSRCLGQRTELLFGQKAKFFITQKAMQSFIVIDLASAKSIKKRAQVIHNHRICFTFCCVLPQLYVFVLKKESLYLLGDI